MALNLASVASVVVSSMSERICWNAVELFFRFFQYARQMAVRVSDNFFNSISETFGVTFLGMGLAGAIPKAAAARSYCKNRNLVLLTPRCHRMIYTTQVFVLFPCPTSFRALDFRSFAPVGTPKNEEFGLETL